MRGVSRRDIGTKCQSRNFPLFLVVQCNIVTVYGRIAANDMLDAYKARNYLTADSGDDEIAYSNKPISQQIISFRLDVSIEIRKNYTFRFGWFFVVQ